jgi:tricorn protease-like protein
VTGTAKNIKFNIVDVSDDKEKYVESNLDRDVQLNLDYIKKARVYFLGNQNGVNIFTVDLGSPSGKDGDEGDLLRMEFQTKP